MDAEASGDADAKQTDNAATPNAAPKTRELVIAMGGFRPLKEPGKCEVHKAPLSAAATAIASAAATTSETDELKSPQWADKGDSIAHSASASLAANSNSSGDGKPHKIAEFKRFRVLPAYQRCGLGSQLLSRLEARAIEMGYTMLEYETSTNQTGAMRMYEKHGYREWKREPFEDLTLSFARKVVG